LGDVVDGAQQSGRDGITPSAPRLCDAQVLNFDALMRVYCCVAVFAGQEIFLWDKIEDGVFDAFCVGLVGLVCNRLDLNFS